jgi:hypothetical protein
MITSCTFDLYIEDTQNVKLKYETVANILTQHTMPLRSGQLWPVWSPVMSIPGKRDWRGMKDRVTGLTVGDTAMNKTDVYIVTWIGLLW